MIRARFSLAAALVMASCQALFAAGPAPIASGGVTGLDLKTQLEKGLKARRPVEFQYIAQINQLVEDGTLPRTLVASTFIWARNKPTRQLQYFQFALQARAKNLGVTLPNLRNQAVGTSTNGGFDGFGNFGHDPTGTSTR
jgi:hypothetical protein